MADNVVLNSGSGGATAAADDIGGVHHQRVKIEIGGDGTAQDCLPISNGLDSTGTGVQAVGLVGQLDDASTGTVTENQFAPIRISERRALLVEGVASGTDIPVSAASLPLPTGASTAAKQPALGTAGSASADVITVQGVASMTPLQIADNGGNISIDDGGNTITVDGTVTAQTGQVLDYDTGAGTQNVQMVGVALPASGGPVAGGTTSNPLTTKISDGTDVADVLDLTNSNPLTVAVVDGDGTQIISFGGGTQYTEDAAAAADPVGTALNLIRADSLAGITSADGDNVAARGTDKGELYVKHVDPIPVTDNGGALTVDGTVAVTNSSLTTLAGAVRAEDEASAGGHTGFVVMARRTDTPAAQSGTDGDYEFLQVVDGRLAATTTVSGTVTVDGSGVTQPISHGALTELAAAIDTEVQVDVVGALPAGTNNIGDVDVASIAAGDNNIGNVDIVTMPNVTLAAGTNTNEVVGDAAHDAAAAGNPLLLGVTAKEGRDTAVSADGDVVRISGDRYGRMKVVAGDEVSVSASQLTNSGDTNLLAAGGAGNKYKVLRVEASNSHATTALVVGLKSASINSGAVFGKKYLPAVGGQAVWVFPQGFLLGGANEAFIGNLSAGGQVEFTIYYEIVAD